METQQILQQHLQHLQILTEEEVKIIVNETILEEHKKGAIILREGQIQQHCYMVLVGCVREYIIDNDGEEKTTAFFTEGDKINSYSSEGKNIPSKHYLECSEDCILTVSSQNFEEDLRKLVPRLDVIIQQIAKEQLSKSKDQITSYVSLTPEDRYLKLQEEKPTLFNRAPQHQIASFLGIKPESLSRIRKRIHEKVLSQSN